MQAASCAKSDAEIRAVARRLRHDIRDGNWRGLTTGQAPGSVQGNLVILPAANAADFERYCARNPRPCPLIAMSAPGDPHVPALGADIDLRTDLPCYRVFENGAEISETHDISGYWRDDLVAFVLGCSYSFEAALTRAGLSLRHIEQGVKVPLYMTDIATEPSGAFRGPMVVSMRPFAPADAIRAIEITARFPDLHGAPVHFGNPAMIGIADIDAPWSGAPPVIGADEVPLFWACGVTPQVAVTRARPALCITHKPGHMLITDRLDAEFFGTPESRETGGA